MKQHLVWTLQDVLPPRMRRNPLGRIWTTKLPIERTKYICLYQSQEQVAYMVSHHAQPMTRLKWMNIAMWAFLTPRKISRSPQCSTLWTCRHHLRNQEMDPSKRNHRDDTQLRVRLVWWKVGRKENFEWILEWKI